jgi:hypothetical protein
MVAGAAKAAEPSANRALMAAIVMGAVFVISIS